MKKIPFLYSVQGQSKKTHKGWRIFLLVMVPLYIASIILWIGDFGGEKVSEVLKYITITFQCVLIPICITIGRRPSMLINAVNNTIVYHSGQKQFRIKPNQIKTLQHTDDFIEITIKNGKAIKINSDNFPTVNMRRLASYIKSIMSNEGEIKNEFFEHDDSGFHVSRKRVLETPNPWPNVFFLFFVFFAMIMIGYWLFDFIFA